MPDVRPGPFTVPVDVYSTEVRVLRSEDAVRRHMRRHAAGHAVFNGWDGTAEATAFRYRTRGGWTAYAVYFRDVLPTPGAVAHECFHLARFILNDRAVKEKGENGEATAYLLEHLVNRLYARFGREASPE